MILPVFTIIIIHIFTMICPFPLSTIEGRYKWVVSRQNWRLRLEKLPKMGRKVVRTWISSTSATGLTGDVSVTSGNPPVRVILAWSLVDNHFTVRAANACKLLARLIYTADSHELARCLWKIILNFTHRNHVAYANLMCHE